ncbi:hypothetical protein AX17_003030 [Amanita inopinata Kibby_2008]|nr:hypothetical protein AX17_003030 [Amanita inopinata Kibby_2008]
MICPELPNELWFKVITLVLSDSIHCVCCSPIGSDTAWDRFAFGTLRQVSREFEVTVILVAKQVLYATSSTKKDSNSGTASASSEPLKQFKLLKYVRIDHGTSLLMTSKTMRIPLVSAYHELFRRTGFRKAFFAWEQSPNKIDKGVALGIVRPVMTNALAAIDRIVPPEAADIVYHCIDMEKLLYESGLDIVYRMSAMLKLPEWHSASGLSPELIAYLDDLYKAVLSSSEMYNKAAKEIKFDRPFAISKLPQVEKAVGLIISRNPHPQLVELVKSWS